MCISVSACKLEATGVRFDDVTRNSRIGRDQGSSYSSHSSREEARLAAVADDPVPDFVRTDDHADCGARQDDRIAASADPRFVPRQHRALRCENEGAGTTNPIAKPVKPGPVDPSSVDPGSVSAPTISPRSGKAGPVFPGRNTAAPRGSGEAEVPVSDALQTGNGSTRRSSGAENDLTQAGNKTSSVAFQKL